MSLSLPFRLVAAVFISVFALIASAHAGGSLAKEDFLGSIADESLRAYVAEHFQLDEEGRALRAGHQMPNPGERMAPFEIVARSAEDGGTAIVLHLNRLPSRQVLIIPCAESVFYDRDCR